MVTPLVRILIAASPSPSRLTPCHLPQSGRPWQNHKVYFSPEAPPLGELLNEVKLRGRARLPFKSYPKPVRYLRSDPPRFPDRSSCAPALRAHRRLSAAHRSSGGGCWKPGSGSRCGHRPHGSQWRPA